MDLHDFMEGLEQIPDNISEPDDTPSTFSDSSDYSNFSTSPSDATQQRPDIAIVSNKVAFGVKWQEPAFITNASCLLCNVRFSNWNERAEHEKDIYHFLRQKYRVNQTYFAYSPNLLSMTYQSDMPCEDFSIHTSHAAFGITITNTSQAAYILNGIYEIICSEKVTVTLPVLPAKMTPGQQLSIGMQVQFRERGAITYPVIAQVLLPSNGPVQTIRHVLKQFTIRYQSSLMNILKPICVYQPWRNVAIPHRRHHSSQTEILGLTQNTTPRNCLKVSNYSTFFHALLHAEEHQALQKLYMHNQRGVRLHRGEDPLCLELRIENIKEVPPSITRGDRVKVTVNDGEPTVYPATVQAVERSKVILCFQPEFIQNIHSSENKYNIGFVLNRYVLQRNHEAVELVHEHKIAKFFFPTPLTPVSDRRQLILFPPEVDGPFFNPLIENNEEQKQAIASILAGTAFPAPYLIFGPPGTGKTVTIVEAIKQIWKLNPRARILATAQSNSAANSLTEQIVDDISSKDDVVRIMATSQVWSSISAKVQMYCTYNAGTSSFVFPNLERMMRFRIVITTLVTASRLVEMNIPPNHFTHVFIDEGGHATETETLIPIAGILSSAHNKETMLGHVIIAGDPHQLGPILHSELAQAYGLGISMLERLMTKCKLYQKDSESQKFDGRVLTKLVKNFRSHPAILYLPNKLFYETNIIPAGDSSIYTALNWEKLKNKYFPVVFHAVIGVEEREAHCPSYFNRSEIDVILEYLRLLIGAKLNPALDHRVKATDIGIVSPYRKQIAKIDLACITKGYQKIEVGSVEQFQGREKSIILISTVRASTTVLAEDSRKHLGFLTNPKRFNVAITRAKSLLIVIGNPNILEYDSNWREFIKYCIINNATFGAPFELTQNVEPSVEKISLDLSALHVDDGYGEVQPNYTNKEED